MVTKLLSNTSFVPHPRKLSRSAAVALYEAIQNKLAVSEIEPIMYVKLRETGRNVVYSLAAVEKFVNFLHSIDVYLVEDLLREKPAILLQERTVGIDLLNIVSFALMNMDTRESCERVFRREALYKGAPELEVRNFKLPVGSNLL